jgi:hypothetical protein
MVALATSLNRHAKSTVTHNNVTITAMATVAGAASSAVFEHGNWAVVLGNAAWLTGEATEACFDCWERIFVR